MRAGNQAGRGRRLALYIVAALAAVVVLGTSLGLMGYIDQKLKQGAEQQVVTFTQQAASTFPSILTTSPCSCLLSSAFRAARLSA